MKRSGTNGEFRLRLRVMQGKSVVMGPGRADLLAGIEAVGSIAAAGRQMGMSYKRAWELVESMNTTFAAPLVEATKGGAGGGGAKLTALGLEVLNTYRALQSTADKTAAEPMAVFRGALKQEPDTMPERIAYKILLSPELDQLRRDGIFHGSAADIADGYIHLSCAHQLAGTLDKYFNGAAGVMLAAINLQHLDGTLRWEPSRGGQLFPHIYGSLPLEAVVSITPLERTPGGTVKLPAQ